MINLEKWQRQDVDPSKAGYSDIRLWPGYLAMVLLILFLAPKIGIFLSVAVSCSAFFIVASIVWGIQSRNPVALRRYDRLRKEIQENIIKTQNKKVQKLANSQIKAQAKAVKSHRTKYEV